MTKFSAHSPAFPQLEGLLDLACRNGVDVRPTLLRVLTDLYVQKRAHRADEEAQYVELALRLVETSDAVTRATVAARLASYPGAPQAVLQKLADLTGYTVTPPEAAPEPVLEVAQDAPQETAPGDLADIFFQSSAEDRRLILLNLDVEPSAARREAEDPAACKLLEAAALTRNPGEFARILERALHLRPALAQRIAEDASGEAILVAAKTLGMPQSALQRVLLFINPSIGQSVRRVYELAALYDEIGAQSAEAMMDIWRGASIRRRSHQPAYYNEDRGSARVAAAASHARTTRRSDSLAARFRNSGR